MPASDVRENYRFFDFLARSDGNFDLLIISYCYRALVLVAAVFIACKAVVYEVTSRDLCLSV